MVGVAVGQELVLTVGRVDGTLDGFFVATVDGFLVTLVGTAVRSKDGIEEEDG